MRAAKQARNAQCKRQCRAVRHHGQKGLWLISASNSRRSSAILHGFCWRLPRRCQPGGSDDTAGRSIAFRTLPIVALAACRFALTIDTSALADNEAWARVLQGVITGLASLAVGYRQAGQQRQRSGDRRQHLECGRHRGGRRTRCRKHCNRPQPDQPPRTMAAEHARRTRSRR